MKLQAEVSDTKKIVELNETDGKLSAVIDGREYLLHVSNPEPGLFLLRDGSNNSLVHVSPTSSGSSIVSINGRTVEVKLFDPKRLRGSSSGEASEAGRAEIKTAMPGKVVRVLVSVGEEVHKGDGVIVVEAMKMQNELKSPKDGVVSEILADHDATVGAGDVLVVID